MDITQAAADQAIRLIAQAFGMDQEEVLQEVCNAYQGYMYDCHECHQEDDMMSQAVFSLCNVHSVIDEMRTP